MKTLNVEGNSNLINVNNQNSNNAKLKKGDIISGLIESIDNGIANVSFKNVNKKVSMNVSKIENNLSVGKEYDFKVSNVSGDKMELQMLGLDKMISEKDLLDNADFVGISSKDVFESYGFVEDEEKEEVVSEETSGVKEDISRNAYEETLKKLMRFENYDIFKISIHEFVDMLVKYNNDKLSGIESSDANLVKSLVENKFEIDDEEVSLPEQLKNDLKEASDIVDEINALEDNDADQVAIGLLKNNDIVSLNKVYEAMHKTLEGKKTDFNVDEFSDELKNVLAMNDIEDTEENELSAKLLITNEIDVTKDNLERVKQIKDSIKNINIQDVIKKELSNYAFGIDTSDICLEKDENLEIITSKIKLNLDKVVNNNHAMNEVSNQFKDIKRTSLKQINDFVSKLTENNVSEELTDKAISDKQTLNEVRLMLTAKSAFNMYSKGINVLLGPIKTVCDNLKTFEETQKAMINSGKLHELNENLTALTVRNYNIYNEEFNDSVKKTIEFYTNRNIELANDKTQITNNKMVTPEIIDDIYGSNMIESHYTLNGEHSITKRNIQEILAMLNIEDTQINEKCGIILSLSNQDVSLDNINKIKAAEEKVEFVINNLTPKVALSIIEDGIDVSKENIDTVIDLINEKINLLKTNDDNKIKNALTDNINNQDELYDSLTEVIISRRIPDEVKDALLGLYKVINKVNKYSDAGLGILNYEPDEETSKINLSLRDIFDATKILERKQYGNAINKTIDDSFETIEVIAQSDRNAKELLDNSFRKIREQIEKNNIKNNESLMKEINDDIKFINEDSVVLEKIYKDQKQITLDDVSKVREFEESKTLLKDNVMIDEVLSNNDDLRIDIENSSNRMKNKSYRDIDEDNHLKELRKERNMEVKNILDDYENNSMDDLDTLDVTRRILEARSNSLERIESINKVLKLTSETNNALSTSVYINDELTNINIYFDNDIDLNADENTMLISMNTENLGDIKADVKINNVNQTLKINYITSKDNMNVQVQSIMSELINSFTSDYKLIDVLVNGKQLSKKNDNNLYIKSMNMKNKLSQIK